MTLENTPAIKKDFKAAMFEVLASSALVIGSALLCVGSALGYIPVDHLGNSFVTDDTVKSGISILFLLTTAETLKGLNRSLKAVDWKGSAEAAVNAVRSAFSKKVPAPTRAPR